MLPNLPDLGTTRALLAFTLTVSILAMHGLAQAAGAGW